MIHVTLPQLCAFLDDELAESSAELVRRHLSECLECTERFARLEAQEETLVRILSDEPEEEFFQQLCASISLGQPDPAERRAPVQEAKPVSKKDAKRKSKTKAAPEPAKKPQPARRETVAASVWDEPIAPARAAGAAPPVVVHEVPVVPPTVAPVIPPPVSPVVSAPVVPVAAEPVVPVAAAPVPPVAAAPVAPALAAPVTPIVPAAPAPAREEHVVGRAERLMREEPAPLQAERPVRVANAHARPVRRMMVQPQRRADDPAPNSLSPRAAAIVAVVCCLVAGSIAWVTLRPRNNQTPSAPRVEQSAPSESGAKASAPSPEELLDRSSPPAPVEVTQESPAPESMPSNDPAPEILQSETNAPDTPPSDEIATTGTTATPTEMEPEVAAPTPAPPPPKKKPASVPKAAPATTPAPSPERLVERAPKNFVPVRTVISQSVVAPSGESSAPAPVTPTNPLTKPDAGAVAMRDAKSASLEAAKTKTPAAFDRSSEAWERAIPLLQSAPEQLAVARREWAQARFQAWAADPNEARREAAIAATRQYLLYAPPGPERDQAWTWLGRLKH